jgi:lysine-specific demethylase/histidyl-hydroxylase NO66
MGAGKRTEQGRQPVGALWRMISDPSDFASTKWGKQPHHEHRLDGFADLLSVEQVDQLLESARRPGFRVVNDGRTVSPTEYTKTVRMGGTSLSDAADATKIVARFTDGDTVVLQGLERSHPPLRRFTRELAVELSNPVQANAYLSPGGGAHGLSRHADVHDVFVLQVDGTKHWDIDGLGELTLVPGDVLYMPRGTMHAAQTGGAPSLHITIGVAAATYRDVLRRAVDALGSGSDDRSLLDRWLPLGFANSDAAGAELETGIEAAIAELADRIQQVKPHEIIERERRRIESRRRVAPSLRPVFDAAALTLDSPVRAAAGTSSILSTEAEHVVIDLDDRQIRMPIAALPALEHLLSGATSTPRQLPGLSEHSQMVVVRRLIKEGATELVRADCTDAQG